MFAGERQADGTVAAPYLISQIMKTTLLCAVSLYFLSGCAANPEVGSKEDSVAAPEYTTGSNIAQRSKPRKSDVRTLTPEELEEIEKNNATPRR